VANPNFGGQV